MQNEKLIGGEGTQLASLVSHIYYYVIYLAFLSESSDLRGRFRMLLDEQVQRGYRSYKPILTF
jgi:hypothetical protein